MDYRAICDRAVGTLGRRGVFRWMQREELISIGCVALVRSGVTEEGLAVVIARRAMFHALDANRVRQRRRKYIPPSWDEENSRTGDPWDDLVYSRASLVPHRGGWSLDHEEDLLDTWEAVHEAVDSLPGRERRAVFLTYWCRLTDSAVAEKMGVSRQTVDRLLQKSYKEIRNWWAIRKSQRITSIEGESTGNPFGFPRVS